MTCLCGCGQPITGRRSKRYVSDSHRKRHNRASTYHGGGAVRARRGRESRTRNVPGTTTQDVRVTDTEPREVHCPCGRLLPRLRGPLPVAVYCHGCEGVACPCANRPAWHRRVGR